MRPKTNNNKNSVELEASLPEAAPGLRLTNNSGTVQKSSNRLNSKLLQWIHLTKNTKSEGFPNNRSFLQRPGYMILPRTRIKNHFPNICHTRLHKSHENVKF